MNPPAKIPPVPTRYKNRILAALPKAEIDRLAPHLSPVTLKLHAQLLDGKADHAYFLEDGLASGLTVSCCFPFCWEPRACRGRRSFRSHHPVFESKHSVLKSEFERNGKLRSHLQIYLLANLIQSGIPSHVWIVLSEEKKHADAYPRYETRENTCRSSALPEQTEHDAGEELRNAAVSEKQEADQRCRAVNSEVHRQRRNNYHHHLGEPCDRVFAHRGRK